MPGLDRVEALSIDLFNTLIHHREGRGRGWMLVEYLQRHDLQPAPWEHSVLYDVFEHHDTDYSPDHPQDARDAYLSQLAVRVFERLDLAMSPEEVRRHRTALWEILGPSSFAVFPEVPAALQTLREMGYPLALVSNWQRGVRHFCAELELAQFFDHILGSADLGVAKPDRRIFAEAAARLGVSADRILHVGDTYEDDYLGGEAAGLQVILIDRQQKGEPGATHAIRGLDELPGLLTRDVDDGPGRMGR